ncbi:MAG: cytochrome b N-terminal domain-containing protein [Pseudomonadota bacterium]
MNPAVQPPWPGALALWSALERALDAVAGTRGNPLRHLGALGFLFFWLLAATGVVLFAVLDTAVAAAYDSVARFSAGPGGLVRSLHRYAADGFVAVMAAHLVRELLHGRYAHFRRFTWITGVTLLPLALAAGVGGFWLAWDAQGQFSAVATAEWLDALPLFATPFTRNFVLDAQVNDRLFSLFVFVHLGVALLLVFGLWAHLQRLVRAAVWPPRPLLAGTLAAMLGLALLWPVQGAGPADLSRVPEVLALDWWLLALHPLMYATSAEALWALAAGLLLGLGALPWLTRARRPTAAVVDPANCNGCRRCFNDCPYAAVTMVPHPSRRQREMARVDAELCAGCGICTGACPSSTPMRRAAALHTGIDMPQQPLDGVRQQLREGLQAMQGPRRIAVFACECAAQPAAAPDVLRVPLLCAGMLPPSFVEDALRHGASAVVVAGCSIEGCAFRLGMRWTQQRLDRQREPRLRAAAPREAVQLVQADVGQPAPLAAAVHRLRAEAAHTETLR